MIIDQNNPNPSLFGVTVATAFPFAPDPQLSVDPAQDGAVVREIIELGGTVGNVINLAAIVDDLET